MCVPLRVCAIRINQPEAIVNVQCTRYTYYLVPSAQHTILHTHNENSEICLLLFAFFSSDGLFILIVHFTDYAVCLCVEFENRQWTSIHSWNVYRNFFLLLPSLYCSCCWRCLLLFIRWIFNWDGAISSIIVGILCYRWMCTSFNYLFGLRAAANEFESPHYIVIIHPDRYLGSIEHWNWKSKQ